MNFNLKKSPVHVVLNSCSHIVDGVYVAVSGLVSDAESYDLTSSQRKSLAIAKDKLYDVKIIIENLTKEFRG